MSEQNSNCPERKVIPVSIEVSVNPEDFPGGSGVEPGPDNTHLVSRGGQLAWDPIALGGDSVNYSTEEQWTGKLWIDGKKIYQTTVLADGLPNSTFRDYPHGILNVEEIVGVEGFFSHSGRMYPLPSVGIHPSEVSLVVSAETFTIWTYRKYTETIKVVVTLRYTCTDR